MKIVWIKWLDAHGQGGPVSLDTFNKQGPLEVVTAGIYASEDKDVVRFSMDFYSYPGFDEASVRNTGVIVKKNIISMKTFTVPDYTGR